MNVCAVILEDTGCSKQNADKETRKMRTIDGTVVEDQQYTMFFYFTPGGVTTYKVMDDVKKTCQSHMPLRQNEIYKEIAVIQLGTMHAQSCAWNFQRIIVDGQHLIKFPSFNVQIGPQWCYQHFFVSSKKTIFLL